MKLLDPTHPFFRPLGVRIGLTFFCLAWGLFEVTTGQPFWAIIFGALGIFSAYEFFFNPNNKFDAPAKPTSSEEPKE